MTAIQAEDISKQYRLGLVGGKTLQEDLVRYWARIKGKEDPFLKIGEANDRSQKGESDFVWSLRDVNFTVEKGEVLGIIGRNGAGKSTLLKILSKVTAPTTGQIKVNGRIASLLEVGTGFHPELTGRENIYLNGAILGMRKKEIDRKFDEIVDFSGVERYIDTPVKRYSSGMYVRLAFAVAAHLESEILIIDEVLAVGDAEFQKKCLGKMKDVSQGEGRTVLFVSHNMAAVKSLCSSAMLLEHGKIAIKGSTDECISYYLKGGGDEGENQRHFSEIKVENVFQLKEISLNNPGRSFSDPLEEQSPLVLNTIVEMVTDEPDRYHVTYHLYNEMGEVMFSFSSRFDILFKQGRNELRTEFPAGFFQSGTYYLHFYMVQDKRASIFHEKDIMRFTVVDSQRELGIYMGREPGFIRPKFKWTNNTSQL